MTTTADDAPLTVAYLPADTSAELTGLTIGQVLQQRAAAAPGQLALVATGHDGKPVRLTYRELLQQARQTAAGLLRLARPGEFVALWAPNLAEWTIIQYGAALAGQVLVALNPVLRENELDYALMHSGAVVLLHADRSRDYDLAAVVARVAPRCPALRTVISLADLGRYTRDAGAAGAAGGTSDGEPELPPVGPLEPVMLQYTSGTTGTPKGVLLNHRALINNAKLTMEIAAVPPGSACLNPLPTFHTASCVIGTLGPLWVGGTMVLMDRFSPGRALELIRAEHITVTMNVPTVLGAIVEAARQDPGPAPRIPTVFVGAANVPGPMIEAVEEIFGSAVHNLFGQTELAPVLTATRRGDSRADLVGSVGRPIPQVEVKITDPLTGETLPPGAPGEICARGYQQLIEYYRDPGGTAAAVDDDGWLHLGDLGAMDERGVITLTGRLKDLIIRGGENIAPLEIENHLIAHPAVLDATVIGLPDPYWGEIVAAAVRLRTPLADPQAELTTFLQGRLAAAKIPARIDVVAEFPMTASGKVQRFRLRDQLLDRR